MKPKVCIVDGYSSGNFLAPEFKKRGYDSIHVQSTKEIFHVLKPTFREEDYVKNFPMEKELEKLIEKIKLENVTCVLPGTETGVELADYISQSLGLPTNGTEKSAARRDKYEMIETLKSAGIPTAKQFKSKNLSEIVAWFQSSGLEKVVLKPIESAGSDNVVLCHNAKEIEKGFQNILGHTNMLGLKNTEVLAQGYLEGDEYFINSVSLEGKHHVTDIWKYSKSFKNGRHFVYDYEILQNSTDGHILEMTQYLMRVLNALEIHFGPAHAEIILTKNGPRLVEIGARIQGKSMPELNKVCVGYGQIDTTVDSYINKNEFLKKSELPYQVKKHAVRISLTSYKTATIAKIMGEEAIQNLSSFHSLLWLKKPGMEVVPTVDYFTSTGLVVLVNENPEQLQQDLHTILKMEKEDSFFEYV